MSKQIVSNLEQFWNQVLKSGFHRGGARMDRRYVSTSNTEGKILTSLTIEKAARSGFVRFWISICRVKSIFDRKHSKPAAMRIAMPRTGIAIHPHVAGAISNRADSSDCLGYRCRQQLLNLGTEWGRLIGSRFRFIAVHTGCDYAETAHFQEST